MAIYDICPLEILDHRIADGRLSSRRLKKQQLLTFKVVYLQAFEM
ncbi:hypothetical protein [Paenibacillus taichungensis]